MRVTGALGSPRNHWPPGRRPDAMTGAGEGEGREGAVGTVGGEGRLAAAGGGAAGGEAAGVWVGTAREPVGGVGGRGAVTAPVVGGGAWAAGWLGAAQP